jgi:hypothetical protein
MSIPVGQLTIEMAANVARLMTDMDRARKIVESSTSQMAKYAAMASKALGAIGLAVGAMAAVKGFAGFIQGAIDSADEASKLAQKAGIATSEVAGLQLAFRQGGVDAEGLQKAVSKLSVGILDGNAALKAMGISARNADGSLMSSREVLGLIADKFEGYSDGVAKTALAIELFGKSGADLIPILNGGAAAIDEYDSMAKKLGLTVGDSTGKSAEKFNDTIDLIGQGLKGIAAQVAEKILPVLESLAGKFFETMSEGNRLQTVATVLGNALKGLYSAALVAVDGFKILFEYLNGYSTAMVEFAKGNFSAAADAITETGRKAIEIGKKSIADVSAVFSDAGNTAVETLARINGEAKRGAPLVGKLAEEAAAAAKKSRDEYEKMIKSADELVASIKFESDAYAMSNVEKESAIALQKLMNMGLKEGTDEYKKYTEAVIGAVIEKEQMKALADLKKKEIEDEKKLEEKALADRLKEEEKFADEIKSINNQIGQSLTDALMSGGMNARDFIVNMFKTMVLRPVLQPIITGMVGMFTGGAASAMGGAVGESAGGNLSSSLGLLDMGSKLKSAYDMLTGGFTSLGETVGNYAASIYGTLAIDTVAAAEGATALMASAGGEASAVAIAQIEAANAGTAAVGATASAAASAMAGIGAGVGLGMLISGDKSLIGGNSMYTVGGGVAAGAAIGSIVPGIGTAIGAVVGGIVGGLANQFGNAAKKVTDFGISGSLSSNGASVKQYSEWEKQGGWFGSDKNGAEFSAVESKVSKYINASVAGSAIAVRQYADILGLPAKGISDFAFEIKRSMDGLSPEEATKALNELLAAYGNSLAATVTAEIGPFQKDGEEAGATLARLATSLQSVNSVFDTLNITLMETSLSGADASSKMIEMFGSVDKFVSATDAYYQAFYTEQERAAKTTEQLTNVFAQLGLSLPNTNAAFRALVESARAAGNDGLFAALIKLAPTFSGLQTSIANMAAATGQSASSIASSATQLNQALDDSFSALKSSIQNELDAALASIETQKTLADTARQVASESVSAFKSIFDYLKGQINDILGTVSTAQTASQGMSFIQNALENAQNTGYMPDQGQLSDAVSAARAGLSSENYATAFEMKRGNLRLASDLQQLQDIAGDQMTTAQEQLAVAEDQYAFWTAQAESTKLYYDNQLQMAQNQVNELRGINGGILSVADAMASFGAAINASRAAANATSNDLTAQVSQMYIDILGRAPDAAGLSDWLSRGISSDQIRAGIMGSQEAKLRGYATGGSYPGGLAMVGESGPELINFNRPGMVYNAAQTNSLLSGESVAGEVRALRTENQAQSRAIVQLQSRLTRVLERWDGNGMPETRVVA